MPAGRPKKIIDYEIVEILEKNIKNYNQCNLDYLSIIQERFK